MNIDMVSSMESAINGQVRPEEMPKSIAIRVPDFAFIFQIIHGENERCLEVALRGCVLCFQI